jgi:putative oxidoreductase
MAYSRSLAPSAPAHRGLNLALWAAQILLALAFGSAGIMTASMPIATLVQNGLVWAGDVPVWLVRFIGTCELAGAVGLILPALIRIRPELTALAALGLLTMMILAMGFHISRREPEVVPMNMVLGGLAVFVAWGRRSKASIASRM